MYKEKIKNLIKLLDKIIADYDEMISFLEEKKEILKKAKSDELGIIDNKIIAQRNTIIKVNDSIKNLSVDIIGKEGSMSDFIEFAKANADNFVEKLSEQKIKICNNIKTMSLLNTQNVELLRHGIVMTDKMLETIVDAFAPQGSIYNETGKTDTHDLDMWTINEEI